MSLKTPPFYFSNSFRNLLQIFFSGLLSWNSLLPVFSCIQFFCLMRDEINIFLAITNSKKNTFEEVFKPLFFKLSTNVLQSCKNKKSNLNIRNSFETPKNPFVWDLRAFDIGRKTPSKNEFFQTFINS